MQARAIPHDHSDSEGTKLLVVGDHAAASYRRGFERQAVTWAANCQQAGEALGAQSHFNLIRTRGLLRDGSWWDVLRLAIMKGSALELEVVNQDGDVVLQFSLEKPRPIH